MKTCYKCDISEDKALLYEGVSPGGVIFVCRKCYCGKRIPLVETKELDMAEINRPRSVRERLNVLAGLKKQKEEVKKPEESAELRKIVEENFKKNLLEDSNLKERLIDKFHWVVMRTRRSMKFTQKEFAEKIFEPLIVVEHLEKGVLPKDYLGLIKKVEGVLNVVLLKEGTRRLIPSQLANESKVSSGLKISDLRKSNLEVVQEREFELEEVQGDEEINPEEIDLNEIEKIVGKPLEKVEDRNSENLGPQGEVPPNGEAGGMELSDEEIRKLIFRK